MQRASVCERERARERESERDTARSKSPVLAHQQPLEHPFHTHSFATDGLSWYIYFILKHFCGGKELPFPTHLACFSGRIRFTGGSCSNNEISTCDLA